jgi:ferritin-like metal-binding protein YciE
MDEDGHEAVLDAGYIAAAQQMEHYEITAYGSLLAWAEILGYNAALPLLRANEREEKAAGAKLSHLAASSINLQAAAVGRDTGAAGLSASRPRDLHRPTF